MSLILRWAPSVSPRGWCSDAETIAEPKKTIKKKEEGAAQQGDLHLFDLNAQAFVHIYLFVEQNPIVRFIQRHFYKKKFEFRFLACSVMVM